MSRLTAAQVIAQGDYLNSDFDPSTLTIPQLLGIFGFHNINYPSQYTKPKLVQLFNDEIKPKANKFKRQRLKRENSQASDDGITDGLTGKPINEVKKEPVRRSSRRASRAPSHDVDESEPAKPDPPKRRRSTASAEPSLGGPSRRRTVKPKEPVVVEESEPEEPAVRKVSRSKKSSADAGTQARKVAHAAADDSGWEDNNIFQSGAEDSPSRPSPVRPRTRRTSARKKSMSAPPEYLSESPTKNKGKARAKPASERRTSVKPPESLFEPELPPEVVRESKATLSRSTRRSVDPDVLRHRHVIEIPDSVDEVTEPADSQQSTSHIAKQEVTEEEQITSDVPLETEVEPDEQAEESEEQDVAEDDKQVQEVSQRIADGNQELVRRSRPDKATWPLSLRLLLAALAFISLQSLYTYKQESTPVGFCETGKSTNAILEQQKAHWAAIERCNAENRTFLISSRDANGIETAPSPVPTQSAIGSSDEDEVALGEVTKPEPCPPLPLIPIPHPESCAPCPAHASCTPSMMTCETGYMIRPHPLLFFLSLPTSPSPVAKNGQQSYILPSHAQSISPNIHGSDSISQLIYKGLSLLFDGLPGFGPVAFPPRCVEDPRRKRNIGALGRAIESILANERGKRLCAGVALDKVTHSEAEEAKKWGLEVETLKEQMKRKTSPHLMPTFEDTFNEAVQQLIQWGGVFIGEDADGKRYLAHHTPSMDWSCSLKVKARESWSAWQKQIMTTFLVMLSALLLRRRRAQRSIEDTRVASLVQIALDLLRNQELAHHTDPVTAPQPYLSSLQLRDLILQDEHSVSARKRLWERVERVVESNANIRTNLEEVEGGDEMRVWRWVGGAGRTLSPVNRPQIDNGLGDSAAA
ncbi:hypothetical protein K474DRAFT_1610816 [Panus rudis PR-1116 ss-1]|nr:hypothetical protein K474DRAFT_1610816 [Panus rudis PR-1116 ss-1]